MHLSTVLLCLGVLTLGKPAASREWCYEGCEFSPMHWDDIPDAFCGQQRQSPVDIELANVMTNAALGAFTLRNFSSHQAIKSVVNDGHTVKCNLEDGVVEVSGGGLTDVYSSLQFHFHWGSSETHPGSEHTVNGHRFPMEMHIVSLKKGRNVTEALADGTGIAVLGFFINGTDVPSSADWENLLSYVNSSEITVDVTHDISIMDLIGNVDLSKFYRYMGSLTTPDCQEAVVWTVFQEPININQADRKSVV